MKTFRIGLVLILLGTATLWMLPEVKRKVYVVQEDHLSISGQLAQARYLLKLYFDHQVRDMVVEGYVGAATDMSLVPDYLPTMPTEWLHSLVYRTEHLKHAMPPGVPANETHRLSIGLPELVAGNISAAEFIAATVPVRLRPGETPATYETHTQFNAALCTLLAEKVSAAVEQQLKQSPSLASEFNSASDRASGAGDIRRANLIKEYALVLKKFDNGYPRWHEIHEIWNRVCRLAGPNRILTVEELLGLYEEVQYVGSADLREQWQQDVNFLTSRSEASRVMAERAGRLARSLRRDVVLIVGAAHTNRVSSVLKTMPGIEPIVIPLVTHFGRLGMLRLTRSQWNRKKQRLRIHDTQHDTYLVRMRRLRKPGLVVSSEWYQARQALASITDRMLQDILQYKEGGAWQAKISQVRNTFLTMTVADPQTSGSAPGRTVSSDSQFAGHLLRATVRIEHARSTLWIAAARHGYLIKAAGSDGVLTAAPVDRLFAWLGQMNREEFARFFAAKIVRDQLFSADEFGIVPTDAMRLGLSTLAVVTFDKNRALRALPLVGCVAHSTGPYRRRCVQK